MQDLILTYMPIVICILTGFVGYLQYRFKMAYEIRMRNSEKHENELNATIQALKNSIDDNFENYKFLNKTLNILQQRLTTNDEVTKRIELCLMIMQHPDQVLAIQRLIEEYTGNHYIYDIVKNWATKYNISLNPKLLEKMDKQQKISIMNENINYNSGDPK